MKTKSKNQKSDKITWHIGTYFGMGVIWKVAKCMPGTIPFVNSYYFNNRLEESRPGSFFSDKTSPKSRREAIAILKKLGVKQWKEHG